MRELDIDIQTSLDTYQLGYRIDQFEGGLDKYIRKAIMA